MKMLFSHRVKNIFLWLIFLLVSTFLISSCAVRETDPNILKLQEAVSQDPDNAEKHVQLASLYFKKAFTEEKVLYLDHSIEETREAVRLKPDYSQAYYMLSLAIISKALVTLDEDLINESRSAFKEALRLNPQLTNVENIEFNYISAAKIYCTKFKRDKKYIDFAIRELKEAIKLNPDSAEAHHMLGRIYFIQQRRELAEIELQEASKHNPDNPLAHQLLCALYAQKMLGDELCPNSEIIESGILACKQAISSKPEEARSHFTLSILYLARGSNDLALFEGKEAIKYSPNNSIFHTLIGILYINNGEYEMAENYFRKAITNDPDDEEAYFQLGFSYFLLNQFDQAIAEFNKSLEKEEIPSEGATLTFLYRYLTLEQIGKHGEAKKQLKEYIKSFEDKGKDFKEKEENYKNREWDLHILNYHLGKLTESELIEKADNHCKKCKAFFYIGYKYFLDGNMQKAKKYFQTAVDTKAFINEEYMCSKVRLEQMGGD